jgi:hypothetical protein
LEPPPRLASVADLRRLLERVLVWRGPLAFWLRFGMLVGPLHDLEVAALLARSRTTLSRRP